MLNVNLRIWVAIRIRYMYMTPLNRFIYVYTENTNIPLVAGGKKRQGMSKVHFYHSFCSKVYLFQRSSKNFLISKLLQIIFLKIVFFFKNWNMFNDNYIFSFIGIRILPRRQCRADKNSKWMIFYNPMWKNRIHYK